MVNYKIEGGINFFDELYKLLDNQEDEFKSNIDETKCLITNQILSENFVTLDCGHKFNYIPLYNDLVNYKQKFNYQESRANMLKPGEIRCPYCRKKQQKILPLIPDLNLPTIEGVNIEKSNIKNGGISHSYPLCEFLLPNKYFNPNYPEAEPNEENLGNVKFVVCNCYGSKFVEGSNMYIPNNDKVYCYKHKKKIVSEYNKELNQKVKEENKKKYLEEKEEMKKKKLEEKEEQKKKKLEEKEEKKKKQMEEKKKLQEVINIPEENMVLNNQTCIQILKTGSNKGKQCGCKIFSNNMCRRHYNKIN